MRSARAITASTRLLMLAALALLGAPVAAYAATITSPTPRQVATAVRQAQRSSDLWATVNICNSRAEPHVVGVRGQMPSLGFSARMAMTVQLSSYSAADKRFIPIGTRYSRTTISLGPHTSGLQQGGALFPFPKAATGDWAASVTFTWIRGGKVLASSTRATTGGHRNADYGSPPHHTAAACRMG